MWIKGVNEVLCLTTHFTVLYEHTVFKIYNNDQEIVLMCLSSITFSVLLGEWYIKMYFPGTQSITNFQV